MTPHESAGGPDERRSAPASSLSWFAAPLPEALWRDAALSGNASGWFTARAPGRLGWCGGPRFQYWLRCAALSTCALVTCSCGIGILGKKEAPRVFVPPAVSARIPLPAERPELPTPPVIAELPPPVPTRTAAAISLPTVPPPPVPEAPRPAPPKPQPAPVEVVETPPPAAGPKLTQVFPDEQRRAYNRELDDSLGRVRRALARVAGVNLSPQLKEIADRVRTFQTQAEQAREQDLVTAVNLARRADLLAKDLLERLPK